MEMHKRNNTISKSIYMSVEEKLNRIRIATTNVLANAELTDLVAKRGYSKVELLKVRSLINEAERLAASQKSQYGDKYKSTDDFAASFDSIISEYRDHVVLARVALGYNKGEMEKLQLNGQRKKSKTGLINQAKCFYINALSSTEVRVSLAKKGITEEELITTKSKIDGLDSMQADKYDKKGAAESATQLRNNVIDELMEWYSGFKKIARVALKNKPQMLEILGISVKNRKTK